MEVDRESLELLRKKRADVDGWSDRSIKETVLRAIDALVADIETGVLSFAKPAVAELGDDRPDDHADD